MIASLLRGRSIGGAQVSPRCRVTVARRAAQEEDRPQHPATPSIFSTFARALGAVVRRALLTILAFLTPPIAAAAAAPTPPRFDPVAFFAGHTEGRGDLRIILRHTRSVRVQGHGIVQPDGAILLEQTVEGAGRTTQHRAWRLREIAPGRYAGTLTEARDGITGDVVGNVFHLHYRTKGGIAVEQWMMPSADRRLVKNRLVARKFGIVVARLDETIRKRE